MSMSEQELEQTLEYMKLGSKNAIMYTINQLAKVSSPAFKNMILPLIKAMVGDMFDSLFPKSSEDKVMNKLNQIEQRINEVEDSIKLHTDNVVVLAAIGDKYGTVRDRAQTLAARVDNIRFNPYLTDEQKVEELAELYKDGVVYDLETALNGATNAFNGDTEFSLEQKSVFDMAYSTAVEKSMFSQEAIEAATPYLMRQLAAYLAGYAALMPVYEAYEQVYGASSLLATREIMAQRLGGVDREGKEMSSTVLQKYNYRIGYTIKKRVKRDDRDNRDDLYDISAGCHGCLFMAVHRPCCERSEPTEEASTCGCASRVWGAKGAAPQSLIEPRQSRRDQLCLRQSCLSPSSTPVK